MYKIISYDIANDRKRKKLSDLLIKYGLYRFQMSVFVGELKESVFGKLQSELDILFIEIREQEDKILILSLPERSLEEAIWIGEVPIDLEEAMGKTKIIFI